MRKALIVGLTVREAESYWRELLETRPDLRAIGRSQITSVESIVRCGGLRGRTADRTELFVHDRAWSHRDAHLLLQEIDAFRATSKNKNGDK